MKVCRRSDAPPAYGALLARTVTGGYPKFEGDSFLYIMKNRKFLTFRARADVIKIDCGVLNADVNIVAANVPNLYIEYTKNLLPHFAEGDGVVTVRQLKSPFWKLKHPALTIYVPECCVPDMTIDIRAGALKIEGGIYNDVEVRGTEVVAGIEGAAFENLKLNAEKLDLSTDGITVKNLGSAVADDGRVELDKSFCKMADCRIKKGNIGLSCSTCDYALLTAEEGNIAANMRGNEQDYTIALDGAAVSGRENVSESGKTIRARAAKGSVVLDFDSSEEPAKTEREEELA